jgi:hypothetical protein
LCSDGWFADRPCYFEVVEDEAWLDQPGDPLAAHRRGVGGQQSTYYYLLNVASVLLSLMANASPGAGRTIKHRLRPVLRPADDPPLRRRS